MTTSQLATSLRTYLLVLLALAGTLACGRKPSAAGPLRVEVTPVLQQDVPLSHEWVGTLDGSVNAEIRPQVEGYVLRQTYKEGAAVRKGAPLFEIDPRPFKASYDQARAAVARDAAARDKAKLDVERFEPLAAQRAVSQQELDNANSSLRQAQATVAASQATFDRAKLNLEWTRVVSPIDGVAGIAKVQVGDLVNGQRVMTTVSTVDPIKVYFNASEREYMSWARDWSGKGGVKGSLVMTLSDGTLYARRGDPLLADRNVDLKTGTITLVGSFPNPEQLLRPGQYAKVRADVGINRGALLVPQRAVWEVQGNSQVAVVGADNKVEIRPIQTGARAGTLVVVEKGLQPGNRIVVEGIQKVSPGQLVNPVLSAPAVGK
jgi:membrane fusion protein (multidrug efflux system)